MSANTTPWFAILSSYWFATSFKWFLIPLVLLPALVDRLVPETERAARLGLIYAITIALALMGPPLFGYLSDRVGRRMPFLGIGAVLTAVALLWMAFAPNYTHLLLAYILLQLSDDLSTGPYSALIPDLVARSRRGVASGWMGTLQVSAQLLAGGVGFLLPNLQLQLLVIALVNLAAAALVIRSVGEVPGLKPSLRGLAPSLLSPWRNPDFRWVWGTRFLVMLAVFAMQSYLQFYLEDVVRSFQAFGRVLAAEPFQAVALLGLLIALGAAVSAIPAGGASDRQGRKRVIYFAGAGLAGAVLLILLFPRYDLLLVLSVVFGVFYGAYVAVDWALVSDVLRDPHSHATDMGLWQISIVLPQVVAGALGGMLERFNAQVPGLGYTLLFLSAAACFVAGTWLVSRIRTAR
ncbi:MFS transporter [Calidithermus timidus]|jgi:MFS family permease|uniref:MFS transporter n=1 Tax=Calidithermus timidus TaxID=307124 RepID=UPI00036BB73A|nr:MFS transporter [Calidithermus timidus]